MARLSGTAVAIRDNSTDVVLSDWLLDELRPLVESNRNMIGWALSELSPGESDLEVQSLLDQLVIFPFTDYSLED